MNSAIVRKFLNKWRDVPDENAMDKEEVKEEKKRNLGAINLEWFFGPTAGTLILLEVVPEIELLLLMCLTGGTVQF